MTYDDVWESYVRNRSVDADTADFVRKLLASVRRAAMEGERAACVRVAEEGLDESDYSLQRTIVARIRARGQVGGSATTVPLFGSNPQEELKQARDLLAEVQKRIDAMSPEEQAAARERSSAYMEGFRAGRRACAAAVRDAVAEERARVAEERARAFAIRAMNQVGGSESTGGQGTGA